jgi:hypothetical protein
MRLFEIISIIRHDVASGALDWDRFTHHLEHVDGLRFAYPAMALAERLAPGTVDATALDRMRAAATARMRRVIDPLSPADAQRLDVLSMQERFMWSATPREHLRRVAHMLVPAPVGHSPVRLMRKYGERAYRLIRRNVAVRRTDETRGTVERETVERETVERDTVERDTLPRGTVERDTVERGRLPRGTLARGTVERPTVHRATTEPAVPGPESIPNQSRG